MAKDVVRTADKIKKWKKIKKIVRISLLILLLILIIVYLILMSMYQRGTLTIIHDDRDSNLAVYETINDPSSKRKLYAEGMRYMDNISIKSLPNDLNKKKDGSHNGENYIAYTFYVENQGEEEIGYYYSMVMDDVILRADEAVRIMIYRNDEVKLYAKGNILDRTIPEDGTIAFRTDEDGTIIYEHREKMMPDDLDKFTIVIWLEGDDPDCTNAIIGGEMKMHMRFTEEHIKKN